MVESERKPRVAHMVTPKPYQCRNCGRRIRRGAGRSFLEYYDDQVHDCDPRIKVFTPEEIEAFKQEKGIE